MEQLCEITFQLWSKENDQNIGICNISYQEYNIYVAKSIEGQKLKRKWREISQREGVDIDYKIACSLLSLKAINYKVEDDGLSPLFLS